jgi:GT2 family glycosyltransferase
MPYSWPAKEGFRMSSRVCAVIVSHNRLEMLKESIRLVHGQSLPPDEVIVVDNASTDGTREWLVSQQNVTTLFQENLGCAGGFDTGLAEGYARGYEWMWCLDDDCEAEPDALERLIADVAAHPTERVFNSLCLAKQDPSRPPMGGLCLRRAPDDNLFGEFLYSTAEIQARGQAVGLLDSIGGQFFMGTLIHRDVIERVGRPLPFFFIRGDEIDYTLRIMAAGYHIWIDPSSITYHPAADTIYFDVLGKKFPCGKMSPQKRYYDIRNSIYIRRKFYNHRPFISYIARRFSSAVLAEFYLERNKGLRGRLDGCLSAARGVRDGLRMIEQYPVAG